MLRLTVSVLVVAAFVTGCGGVERAQSPDGDRERLMAAYADLPLTFVENRGQTDARVDFLAQGPRHAVYVTPEEIALTLQQRRGAGVALALRFVGADPGAEPSGAERRPRHRQLPARRRPRALADGAARLRPDRLSRPLARDRPQAARPGPALKYEFVVRPGARPADIRLAYRGAEQVRRDETGALQIQTALGALRDAPPVSYQEIDGVRRRSTAATC